MRSASGTSPRRTSATSPRRARRPLGRGFERFYGFFDGETHQFAPALVHDNHQVEPPRTIAEGYHLTEDLVDRGIEFVRDLRAVDDAKPFFMYFCTGTCHSPHQAPRAWIDRYRGRFDRGWDAWRAETLARQIASGVMAPDTELSPRPEWVPPWSAHSADERRVYARYMEAFAGFLSHTDHDLGRLLAFLAQTGDLSNTLVVALSDNGASSEGGPTVSLNDLRPWNLAAHPIEEAIARIDEIGGPRCHNNYPWGWTVAGNMPFRRWKREVHEGGVADPLIVCWPQGIAAHGELRRQYVHAIDIVPTVLEAIGIDAPATIDGYEQRAIEGTSFAYTFAAPEAADRHQTQYYEMFGCRALYHRGWKAVTYHPIQDLTSFERDAWELYDVRRNPTGCHDLAAEHPDKLRELIERWWVEAERYQVLPLDSRALSELVFERPSEVPRRARYVYYPGMSAVPEAAAVNVRNRSHTITATVTIPPEGAEGVLAAQGSLLGGWSFYVQHGRLHYVHNFVGLERHHVAATVELAPGACRLACRFTRTGEHRGQVTLIVDGVAVGAGEMPRFTPTRFSFTGAGLTCGRGASLAVTDDYAGPFPFTGVLEHVVIEVEGTPFRDPATKAEAAIRAQ
jgi:arylsulfatase